MATRHGARVAGRAAANGRRCGCGCSCSDRPRRLRTGAAGLPGRRHRASTGPAGPRPTRSPHAASWPRMRRSMPCDAARPVDVLDPHQPAVRHAPGHRASSPAQRPSSRRAAVRSAKARSGPGRVVACPGPSRICRTLRPAQSTSAWPALPCRSISARRVAGLVELLEPPAQRQPGMRLAAAASRRSVARHSRGWRCRRRARSPCRPAARRRCVRAPAARAGDRSRGRGSAPRSWRRCSAPSARPARPAG